jgi:hypothetical protein
VALITGRSDDQLVPPARPPRARLPPLAAMTDHVPIGHYDAHRCEIEAKLHTPTA